MVKIERGIGLEAIALKRCLPTTKALVVLLGSLDSAKQSDALLAMHSNQVIDRLACSVLSADHDAGKRRQCGRNAADRCSAKPLVEGIELRNLEVRTNGKRDESVEPASPHRAQEHAVRGRRQIAFQVVPGHENDEIEAGALSSLIGGVDDPLGIVVLRQGVGDQCQGGATDARTARKVLRARDDLHWPQQPILSSPT